jgi:peptidoglycan/xylan/chitin deacetylase (PgdA/CDA1 family)
MRKHLTPAMTTVLIALFRRIARAVAAQRSCILAYHGVGELPAGWDPHRLVVDEQSFGRHLDMLLGAGFEFVTVSDYARRTGAGERGLVALTFDDGMRDNHDVVSPMLAARGGLPATVFVISGLMGRPNPWMSPAAEERFMTAAEVLALRDAGWEIGAHTETHPDLSTLDRATCAEEMRRSRDALEALIGAPVPAFAYPFCRYGPAAYAAAGDAGFDLALTCEGRGSSADRHALRRTIVVRGDGDHVFLARVAGVYDPLVFGRAGTWARARSRGVRTALRRARGIPVPD